MFVLPHLMLISLKWWNYLLRGITVHLSTISSTSHVASYVYNVHPQKLHREIFA